MAEEDAELVALIDNELDEDAKQRLLARLANDDALRKRYEALRDAGPPILAAFDALLNEAPFARLRAALPPDQAPRAASRRFAGFAIRQFAAGIVIGFLAAAAAAAMFVAWRGEAEDWRGAVGQYAELYTNETFAFPSPDAALEALQLSSVASRVGAALTPASVTLPGLQFKVAFILAFDGSPLAEIAYVDARGEPVLLCVIANGAADAPTRSSRRGELSLSSWSRGGRGYLVVGRLPPAEVAEYARALEPRL